MTIDLDQLERLAKAAPSGQWEVWTSNSWRRVYANQGHEQVRVIEPVVQRTDNHPDLWFGQGVAEYLEGVTPDAILELVAEVRRLREFEEAIRTSRRVFNGTSEENSPMAVVAKQVLDEFDAARGEK
jgi:hypothetical protein